jgi:hypothetical protein
LFRADYLDGIHLWHVDASLTPNGYNFAYDNQSTEHKLLKLMEANGGEIIEHGGTASPSSFYVDGYIFGSQTIPNSNRYNGLPTNMGIADIHMSGQTVTFNVRDAAPSPTLTVLGPPESVTAIDGRLGIFRAGCVTGGKLPYHYQWYSRGSVWEGVTDTILALIVNSWDDGLKVKVAVTDSSSPAQTVITPEATLTVVPVLVVSTPVAQTVNAGTTATFSVSASGGKTPYSYQWYRNGSPISGATSSTYSFVTANADNGALFKVVVTDALLSAQSVSSGEASLGVIPSDMIAHLATTSVNGLGYLSLDNKFNAGAIVNYMARVCFQSRSQVRTQAMATMAL